MLTMIDYAFTLNDNEDEDDVEGTWLGRIKCSKTATRIRVTVPEIFESLGPPLVRKSYRMTQESFWMLFDILENKIPNPKIRTNGGGTKNGIISKASRLSMALRYCAVGDPCEICLIHKVCPAEF